MVSVLSKILDTITYRDAARLTYGLPGSALVCGSHPLIGSLTEFQEVSPPPFQIGIATLTGRCCYIASNAEGSIG